MSIQRIIGHSLFWCILMLTYAISEWGYHSNFQEAILFELLFLPVRLVAVYTNWFYLIPGLLYKQQFGKYASILLALVIFLAILQQFILLYAGYPLFFPEWASTLYNPWMSNKIVQNLVIICSPLVFSMGIRLFMDWYSQKLRSNQLVREKQQAELKYLKAQINPHFLFNVLNNLYGLSLEKSERVPLMITRLSDLLSYTLYESSVEQTSLGREIQLIRDFISLEQDRYGDRVAISWDIGNEVNPDISIAPLIFIPLVENAFKHGVKTSIEPTHIYISLNIEKGNLYFRVANTIHMPLTDINASGIGLKNLKSRLELAYPNTYTLRTVTDTTFYSTTLTILLNA